MKKQTIIPILIFLLLTLTFAAQLNVATATTEPSLVATTTSEYATYVPYQRKVFYGNGRLWIFFSDGANMVYTTSTDGKTWSAPTIIKSTNMGFIFSICYDGQYVHYAYAEYGIIYYRRGIPNSDGTITWSGPEQYVSTRYNSAVFPSIAVDTDGYVWIGYEDWSWDVPVGDYAYVIKSGKNDGTWGTTPEGFPYRLSSYGDYWATWAVSLTPLSNGKMLVLYAVYPAPAPYVEGYQQPLSARCWDGESWLDEINATALLVDTYSQCAVGDGDYAQIVYVQNETFSIIHTIYNYTSNTFGAETVIYTPANYTYPVLTKDTNTGDLYCFLATLNVTCTAFTHIAYIQYHNSTGQWDADVTDWINEEEETVTGSGSLNVFYQNYGNQIGLVYMTKAESPWNLKFALLGFNLSVQVKDLGGTPLKEALVYVGTAWRTTADGWANFTIIPDATVQVKIKFQDVWVNETAAIVTMDADKTVEVTAKVYSLTVKVQYIGSAPTPDCPLSLYRDGTLLNGKYGLPVSPKTNSSGMFTWQQLAIQTASYIIKSSWAGVPDTSITLTENTLVNITITPPAPVSTPTPTPTPPAPTIPTSEQIVEAFRKVPILIFVPIGIMIAAYAVIARRRRK